MSAKKKLSKLTPQEQQILRQAQEICEILETPGWKAIISFMQNSIVWPDPKTYHSKEEAILPYTESYGMAEMVKKILEFTNSQEDIIKNLTAKLDEDAELPNYSIGS
jgi:hypothetical protein